MSFRILCCLVLTQYCKNRFVIIRLQINPPLTEAYVQLKVQFLLERSLHFNRMERCRKIEIWLAWLNEGRIDPTTFLNLDNTMTSMDQLKCHKNIGARTHAKLTSFLKIETVLTFENPTHLCRKSKLKNC
jgi:hypothetical protein